MKLSAIQFIIFLFSIFLCVSASAKDFDVGYFDIRPDKEKIQTRSIQFAIDYINKNGGGRLIFTPGDYRIGSIYLKSNVTLHLEKGAVLAGTTNPFDYDKNSRVNWMSMIFAIDQENIGITGSGMIDGKGFITGNKMVEYIHSGIFIDPLKYDRPSETNRPQNIYFRECKNIVIKGITLKDPASWNQTYDQCVNLLVDSITVDSKSYWNNDGIDIVDCDSVIIRNSFFDAADDVLCLKSHDPKKVCQNVLIENCVGRSSANGLKFGTASRGGFKNITVRNLTIYDTYRSAITFAAVDGGFVENIVVDSVRSINTGNVIYLRIGDRTNYGKRPYMKNIRISNVYAEVPLAKADAGYNYEGPVEDLPRNISPSAIVGMPNEPIEDLWLKNIEIVYPGGADSLYVNIPTNDKGLNSIPEMPDAYPEFSQFKELPAWGFFIRDAKNIHLENVKLSTIGKDFRPAVVLDNVKNYSLKEFSATQPGLKDKKQVITRNSSKQNN